MAQKILTIDANGLIAEINDAYQGTVTSVSAITLGTTGTDLSSSVTNSTTTPVITLNVPTASASNRGALSASDWSTFNGKQNALGYTPVNKAGDTMSGGLVAAGISSSGICNLSASNSAIGGLPSAWSGGYGIGFQYASAVNRIFFGDGSGYSVAFSRRSGSATTDVVTILDDGTTTITGVLTAKSFTLGASVSGAGGAGTLIRNDSNGMLLQPITGSVYDFAVLNVAANGYIMNVPTGTKNVTFGGAVGFNNASPLAKPTITGSRGSNAALASLLTALANYGLITDSTS